MITGTRRLTVQDAASTAASGVMTENAAYPQALSRIAATSPACRNPCCWVSLSSWPTASSTPPVVLRAYRGVRERT